jgi:hypothetical protein
LKLYWRAGKVTFRLPATTGARGWCSSTAGSSPASARAGAATAWRPPIDPARAARMVKTMAAGIGAFPLLRKP